MKKPLRKMILLLMLFVCPFITYSDDDDNPCPPSGSSPGPCYTWKGKPTCAWVYSCSASETCCGGSCVNGSTHGCCNDVPYQHSTHGCCNGVIYEKSSESCCNGVVYNTSTHGCCGGSVYDKSTHGCCNGVVYDLGTHDCCEGVVYDMSTHGCCGGDVYNKDTQGCCSKSDGSTEVTSNPENADPNQVAQNSGQCQNGYGGVTFCYNGSLTTAICPDGLATSSGIQNCIQIHENVHTNDPNFSCSSCATGGHSGSQQDRKNSECRAWQATLDCLFNSVSPTDPDYATMYNACQDAFDLYCP